MSETAKPSSGRQALGRFAPGVAEALSVLEGAAWSGLEATGRTPLGALAARVVAAQHGLPPLEPPAWLDEVPSGPEDAAAWRDLAALDEAGRVALAFAEQMSFDVASLEDRERKALFAALGADAVVFVQFLYVADLLPRARAALDALFGESVWPEPPASASPLQAAVEDLIRGVPQLHALDPVSTELVRLLGARRHRCRICQSLRSRSALVAGADESLFEAVDRYEQADDTQLSASQRAALAFADAMISPPARVSSETARRLRDAHPAEACVELVLDVVRNATNKVAVALAADAPNVESGIEIYDVGPDGELLYGLEAP